MGLIGTPIGGIDYPNPVISGLGSKGLAMTDFKAYKKAMYCTPLDVRIQLEVLGREVSDSDDDLRTKQEIHDAKIEQHIYKADSIVRAYLAPVYGENYLAQETPYFRGPVPVRDNASAVYLTGVVVASTAITEQWLIRFTSTTDYKVWGSFSGYQGAGSINNDFTSSNSDIQIVSADWMLEESGVTPQIGDQFLLGTYISHPTVSSLSSMLAASSLIDSLYSESEGSASGWGDRLYKQVMEVLKNLADEDHMASLVNTGPASTTNPAIPWNIDDFGRDRSPYNNIPYDVNPFGDTEDIQSS